MSDPTNSGYAANRQLRIAMIVNTHCDSDARVIRAAEALAAAGHVVRVLCRQDHGLPLFERRGGVEYQRFALQGFFSSSPVSKQPKQTGKIFV
jgi:hypothetical protein